MTLEIKYTAVQLPRGEIFVAATEVGICWVHLGGIEAEKLSSRLGEGFSLIRADDDLRSVGEKLTQYFEGEKVKLDDSLDLRGTTSFQRDIWRIVAQIPHGQTKSYKWVAKRVGRPQASRGVGRTLALNPVPIFIPCHRVTNSDGRLGGFAAGLEWKKTLLELEGVQLSLDLRVVGREKGQ